MRPKLLVFASGSKDEEGKETGGSGFENLVKAVERGELDAEVRGVVSSREFGLVRERAERLRVPFIFFPAPYTAEEYQRIARESRAKFFALSGWLKLVRGIDRSTPFNSRTVFNIHPGLLPQFGGPGMFGHHVHEAVIEAYRKGVVTHSAVSMHFVTEEYDRGPKFFDFPVEILPDDDADTLGKRVNAAEHVWQPRITNLVLNGQIRWDGHDPESLVVPEHLGLYEFS